MMIIFLSFHFHDWSRVSMVFLIKFNFWNGSYSIVNSYQAPNTYSLYFSLEHSLLPEFHIKFHKFIVLTIEPKKREEKLEIRWYFEWERSFFSLAPSIAMIIFGKWELSWICATSQHKHSFKMAYFSLSVQLVFGSHFFLLETNIVHRSEFYFWPEGMANSFPFLFASRTFSHRWQSNQSIRYTTLSTQKIKR